MKLSKKQQLAIDLMASGANVYLTGYAGTGDYVKIRLS